MNTCSKLLINKIRRVCEKEFKSKYKISYENNKYMHFTKFGNKYSVILINLMQENSWGIHETLSKFNNTINSPLNKIEKCATFNMNVYSDLLINGMYA